MLPLEIRSMVDHGFGLGGMVKS